MQEAIEKDMESINAATVTNVVPGIQEDIITQIMGEELPLIIESVIKIEEEEKKSANEEDTQVSDKQAVSKEIQLSAEQFKLI